MRVWPQATTDVQSSNYSLLNRLNAIHSVGSLSIILGLMLLLRLEVGDVTFTWKLTGHLYRHF